MTKRDIAIQSSADDHGLRGPNVSGEYSICCPFVDRHSGKPDTKYRLQVNPARGVFHCYRCGASGKADLSWLGVQVERDERKRASGGGIVVDLGPPSEFECIDPSAETHRPYADYVRSRGVWEAFRSAGGGICVHGRYAGRVVVPVVAGDGSWRGFTARAIDDNVEPKYLTPRAMPRREILWNFERALVAIAANRNDSRACLWLTEGVFSALPLWPYGICSMGKAVTDEQLALLASSGVPVVVALDGDAVDEAWALQRRLWLRGKRDVWLCQLPPKTDPGNIGWDVENYLVA